MRGGRVVNIKLYSLIRYLQKPGGVSIEYLQEELNVSRATVFRYLNVLQEMELPVTSEMRGRKCYYFFDMENPLVGRNVFENMPYMRDDFFFDRDEKMLIEYLFANTEATVPSLRSDIKKLHEKMQVLLSFAGHVSDSAGMDEESKASNLPRSRDVRKISSFHDLSKRSEEDKLEIISRLSDAVAAKKVCIVTYRAAGGVEKTYRIMPLVVFSYQGGFYTIVETEKYAYTSKLAIERIIALDVTGETFRRKTDLDIAWIMSDPFGLVQVDQFMAIIEVRKESVERIKDRDWPKKRVQFTNPDGKGNVRMKVITSGAFELVRWLRYMGDEVRLLEPSWLVDDLKATIDELKENYDKLPKQSSAACDEGAMAIPLTLGVYDDGSPLTIDLRNAPHLLLAGGVEKDRRGIIAQLTEVHWPKTYVVVKCPSGEEDLFCELDALVEELERRYRLIADAGLVHIMDYNTRHPYDNQPYIVFVVTDLDDITDKARFEDYLRRIAAKAKSAGIHFVLSCESVFNCSDMAEVFDYMPSVLCFHMNDERESELLLDTSAAISLPAEGEALYRQGFESGVVHLTME